MTQEIEEKKAYLKSYEKAKLQIKRIDAQIEELMINKTCPSMVYDDMPHTHNIKDLSDFAAMMDEFEHRQQKLKQDLEKLCKEIIEKVELLDNEHEKDVLTYRYIKLMTWPEICKVKKKSAKQIHRIHGNALKNFQI